jgi:hypothetical protein
LTDRQKKVIELIEKTFWIRDGQGNLKPYHMTGYEKHFHSNNLIALEQNKWKNRIMKKSRGIGATTTLMIDYVFYIVSGYFENVIFPISSYKHTASIDLIKKASQIIKDSERETNTDFQCEMSATTIKSLDTGCELRAVEGGNPDSFRRFRAPAFLIDEFAFSINPEELYGGAEPVISEGGIGDVAGTVVSHNDYFMKLCNQSKLHDSARVFELPLFDPSLFDNSKPLSQQTSEPIAPWFNLEQMELKRKTNPDKFMREMMCIPVDAGKRFYELPLIMSRVESRTVDEIVATFKGNIYKVLGVDIGSLHDYAGIVEFSFWENRWWNTYNDAQRLPLPELQDYLEGLIKTRGHKKVQTDCTGQGLQIGQYLKNKFPGVVKPINFAGRTIDKQKVREYIAINFRTMLYEDKVRLLNNDMLISHLNSWNAELTKSADKEAHGDLAVAAELALAETGKFNDVRQPVSASLKSVNVWRVGGSDKSKLLTNYRG